MISLLAGCLCSEPPVEVPKLLAAGPVACVLSDGRAVCETVERESAYPTESALTATGLQSLSMSGNLLCGIDWAEAIQCWGFDQYGVLDVPQGEWAAVAAGNSHACAIDATGSPTCWGASFDYALEVPEGTVLATVLAGDNRTCGLNRDGSGWTCWGADRALLESRGVILGVPGADDRLVQVDLYGVNLFVVLEDGTLGYWGYPGDSYGRDQVPTGDAFVRVDAGTNNACATRTDGTVVCWGTNAWGQDDIPTGEWRDVAAGDTSVCARDDLGDVTCWGCGGSCPVTNPQL